MKSHVHEFEMRYYRARRIGRELASFYWHNPYGRYIMFDVFQDKRYVSEAFTSSIVRRMIPARY